MRPRNVCAAHTGATHTAERAVLSLGALRVPCAYDRDLWAYKLARRNKLISRLIGAACVSRGRVLMAAAVANTTWNGGLAWSRPREFSTTFFPRELAGKPAPSRFARIAAPKARNNIRSWHNSCIEILTRSIRSEHQTMDLIRSIIRDANEASRR